MTAPPYTYLPRVDRHAVVVAATADATFDALWRTATRSFAGGAGSRYARAIGCELTQVVDASTPVAGRSQLVGFGVVRVERPQRVELAGRHRCSRYRLVFELTELGDGRTELAAVTYAAFPGLLGAAYRALVIGTRMHVLVTNGLLRAVRRRAERDAPTTGLRPTDRGHDR